MLSIENMHGSQLKHLGLIADAKRGVAGVKPRGKCVDFRKMKFMAKAIFFIKIFSGQSKEAKFGIKRREKLESNLHRIGI